MPRLFLGQAPKAIGNQGRAHDNASHSGEGGAGPDFEASEVRHRLGHLQGRAAVPKHWTGARAQGRPGVEARIRGIAAKIEVAETVATVRTALERISQFV